MLNIDIDVIAEVPLPVGSDPAALKALVEWALELEGATGDWSIAVVLTSDVALRTMHRLFLGVDSETDVMTFPYDDVGAASGGDIVVSVERAAGQGPEWGISAWEEIRFLVVHGVLHLCGWDDGTDANRSAMLDRQRLMIDAFDLRVEPA